MNVLNSFTVDVEEWYQTELFNRSIYREDIVTDLSKNIYEILALLDEYNTKATFFIVASIAEKYPEVVKMIVTKGHEVASHGYLHKLVFKRPMQEFIDDIKVSLDILRQVTKTKIIGYRAPTWSIRGRDYKRVNALKFLGLKYDSSIYPVSLNLLTAIRCKKFPYEIEDGFIEFSPSVFKFFGYNFPFAGGTFLRFFSFEFMKNRISEINRRGKPAMVYFHSWEFDEIIPNLYIPKWKRLIQYGNLRSVKIKLRLLLQNFKFSSMREVLQLD